MNSKGQAALMDSIFFLTIVSSICTGLFFFAINYGVQLDSQINSFYESDFAADSLKVITYINVMRDGSEMNFPEENAEYDYLLALIKEDYADSSSSGNPKMSDVTTKSIARTLNDVMKPFDVSIDYAFYMLNESESDFLFLMLAQHECTSSQEVCESTTEDKEIERVYYYCDPLDTKILQEKIYPYVGKVNSAYGKTILPQGTDRDREGIPFLLGLDIWITTNISGLDLTSADFKCEKISLD